MTRKQARIQLRRTAVELGAKGLRAIAHNVKGGPTLELVKASRWTNQRLIRGERIVVRGRTWDQVWNRMVATMHGNREEAAA